jgi:hypothetical protein
MKKLFLITVLLVGLIQLNAQKYIRFGARERYYLSPDEKQMPIDSGVLQKYDFLNPDLKHQVPLNRYIKSSEYDLFIGLAIYDSPEQILDFYRKSKDYSILNLSEVKIKKNNYYFLFAKFAGQYNLKIIFKTKKSRYTVVMNYLSSNRELLEKFYYQKDIILKKIKKKYKNENKKN